MKISILLPYKENFSPDYPGAVSLFVYETSRISKYKRNITVFGNTEFEDTFKLNYKNILLKKKIFSSQTNNYVKKFINLDRDTNSSIIEIIDQSGDRGCEAISKYARGINPAVSVSYSNVTNNAGINVLSNVRSAKMPYTIMHNQGAFRPPIQTQYELLPLSRQPRELTSVSTNASIIDFSKKMLVPQPASKTKEVKTTKLFTLVRPTVTNKILGNKSSQKPNGIENMIQAKVKINIIH